MIQLSNPFWLHGVACAGVLPLHRATLDRRRQLPNAGGVEAARCQIGARLVPDWCQIGARLVPDWCQIGAMVFYMHVAGKMACHSPENRFWSPRNGLWLLDRVATAPKTRSTTWWRCCSWKAFQYDYRYSMFCGSALKFLSIFSNQLSPRSA